MAASPAVASAPAHSAKRPRNFGLDILRIVSICGVVAIHVFGWMVGKPAIAGSTSWTVAAALDIGFIWVVPVFVMISGALNLTPRAHARGPAAFYRSRAVRLLPAAVVWTLVYLVLVRGVMRQEELGTARVAQLLLDGTVFTQLYFLWLIIGLYAVAPVLAAFLHAGGRRRALATAAVGIAFSAASYGLPAVAQTLGFSRPLSISVLSQWWPYVGYFVAGYALSELKVRRGLTGLAGVLALALAAFAVWEYLHRNDGGLLRVVAPVSYLGPGVAALSLCVFIAGNAAFRGFRPSPRTAKLLVKLSEASFGVFLVHLVFFEAIRLNIPAVNAGTSLPVIAAAYAATLVASFAVALVAARIPVLRLVF